MRYLFAAALVALVLGTAALPSGLSQPVSPYKPCRAQSVYVAALGDSAEAERFRQELERQLKKRRFTTAARAEDADATLTGRFSFSGNEREGKIIFDAGALRDREGAVLWEGSFHSTHRSRQSLQSGGGFKSAASNIAANLRSACR